MNVEIIPEIQPPKPRTIEEVSRVVARFREVIAKTEDPELRDDLNDEFMSYVHGTLFEFD